MSSPISTTRSNRLFGRQLVGVRDHFPLSRLAISRCSGFFCVNASTHDRSAAVVIVPLVPGLPRYSSRLSVPGGVSAHLNDGRRTEGDHK